MRGYLRHRETLIQSAVTTNRMQKALVQMNLLHVVISDITGATGLRIIRDIVREIAAALTGHYRPEHLFVLKQNLELFEAFQRQIEACDIQVEAHLADLARKSGPPAAPLPSARSRRKPRANEPYFDVRMPLHQLSGADLSQIGGIGPYNTLRLLSEIGTDMSRWPTERHFTSWLTLAPNNKVSGGRLLRSRTQPSANRAAMSLGRTQTALGAFYRPSVAVIALALPTR